jgi:hypothetical protein
MGAGGVTHVSGTRLPLQTFPVSDSGGSLEVNAVVGQATGAGVANGVGASVARAVGGTADTIDANEGSFKISGEAPSAPVASPNEGNFRRHCGRFDCVQDIVDIGAGSLQAHLLESALAGPSPRRRDQRPANKPTSPISAAPLVGLSNNRHGGSIKPSGFAAFSAVAAGIA